TNLAKEPVWEAKIDTTAPNQPAGKLYVFLKVNGASRQLELTRNSTIEERLHFTFDLMSQGDSRALNQLSEVDAVAHRIVHGGAKYASAAEIDEEVEREIEQLGSLSPLHNPVQLQGVRTAKKIFGPAVWQIAVFDTAFHHSLPREAKTYAGPFSWIKKGIIRYGFHGSSFRYATDRVAHILGPSAERKMILCHLGGGCSLAAVLGDKSIDTTMGFSPLDGIAMCTRSGALDPGILIYLLRRGVRVEDLDELLNEGSGLSGLAGLPGDTRVVIPEAAKGNDRARLALDVFIHRLRAGIGSMMASLGGCDVLVFTDAIGESEPAIRAAACESFSFLGLRLDPKKNDKANGDAEISTEDSKVRVLVIESQESWQVAQEAVELCIGRRSKKVTA
ncbi:MAG TPA: acetate/propionate family kinase, partial [Chthoniobacterales bacterium]|nr:acetate/propionate family kinase [Chthoniobacterales bacterium]